MQNLDEIASAISSARLRSSIPGIHRSSSAPCLLIAKTGTALAKNALGEMIIDVLFTFRNDPTCVACGTRAAIRGQYIQSCQAKELLTTTRYFE
jgi:hypothetical protein